MLSSSSLLPAQPATPRWRQLLQRALSGVLASSGWTARRTGEKRLALVDSLALGPKKQLVLIRCGEQEFLVGLGADSVFSIHPLTSPAEHA